MAARRLGALALVVLLAGCFGSAGSGPREVPAQEPPVVPPTGPAPGLYDLGPEGLVPLEEIPGLVATTSGTTTKYTFDARFELRENTDILYLVQSLEDQVMQAELFVDIPLEAKIGEGPGGDILCIETSIWWRPEHDFYYERAAGRAGTPPPVDEHGNSHGGGTGQSRAGTVSGLVEIFGDRLTFQSDTTLKLPNGTFALFTNGVSQYPPAALQNDDSTWQQTFAMPGAHRVVRIPSAPLYCSRGFGEFEGAQIVGEAPFEITNGGHREITTLYGSNAILNVRTSPEDVGGTSPLNSATVDFLGETCHAGDSKAVHRSSFDAGTMAVDVGQWAGHPIVILSGLAYGQNGLRYPVSTTDQCS